MTLVIVVPYTVASVSPMRIADACDEHGGVTFLVHEQDQQVLPMLPMLEELAAVILHHGDAAEVVEQLAPHRPDGVVTFADSTIRLSAAVAAAFGLAHNSPETCELLRNKRRQRQHLNAGGVGRIVTVPFSFDAPDAVTIDASAVFPAIVKPEEGAGSEDVIYAESPDDLRAKLSDLRPGRPYVIEEYIPGGEPFGGEWLANYLSVESVVTHGQVCHLGMSGRLPLVPVAREAGALFPVAGDERVTREIEELVERAVRAIGISVGLTHTEVKLTPDGPQIIEVNGRLGGGMSRMIPRAGLIDPVRLAVDLAAGRGIELDFGAPRRVAMMHYMQPPLDATALRALPTPAEVRALPGVTGLDLYKRADDPVDWRQGSFGRVGDLWLEADSLEQLREYYVTVQGFLERSVTYH